MRRLNACFSGRNLATAVPMFMGLLGLLSLMACTSVPSAPRASEQAHRQSPMLAVPPDATASLQRNDVAFAALSLLDMPYAWGGKGPATGFDCSGLVSHVYKQAAGLVVKGTAAELGQRVRPIDRSRLQPGDLVFFNTLGARHSHVGIYVGDGRFVHASNPRTGVRIDLLSNRYYAQRFEGAGALLD
jgi:cell wall-associated NlpC family hydrolase